MGNEYDVQLIGNGDAGADGQVGETAKERTATHPVQWILQPRGGARHRGPRNFQHSVRDGIRLSEYADALGAHAAEFWRIFPDGVARLWGATPTGQKGNAKAVALRERRVGDEMLFYADSKFIAKARILGLFRNRELARAVWGMDEEAGSTWEHIVALGDVVEFEVPAAPLLTELSITPPLRSLTLVRAADRVRAVDALDAALNGSSGPSPAQSPNSGASAPRPGMVKDDLLRALDTLGTHTHKGKPSLHQPLSLLWAIGRLASGQGRVTSWDTFRAEVGTLLEDFGRPDSRATPEYPFWHLRGSGLWEVQGVTSEDFKPTPSALAKAGASAGFTREAARLLQRPLPRAEAIGLLCSRYLADVDQEALLERVGLLGYASASGHGAEEGDERNGEGSAGPVNRRTTEASRPDRDPRLVTKVKLLHRHSCQVCGIQLETRFGHYSEAAHIQGLGSPHDGPDELSNLLCLCPNHHVQFDRLAIYIDEDWVVRRSRDGEAVGPLTRQTDHRIDQERVRYHRGLCGRPAPAPAPAAAESPEGQEKGFR
ncbi:HNH endonuclease [Streptomyces sp. NPDC042319]|uniref:HNH endonuclease n=1 Tax=Streptomyces sp. NPDC042319 TaxID=3154332 RepID=UPI0033C7558C